MYIFFKELREREKERENTICLLKMMRSSAKILLHMCCVYVLYCYYNNIHRSTRYVSVTSHAFSSATTIRNGVCLVLYL